MDQHQPTRSEPPRIYLDKQHSERLKNLFPGMSYQDAIADLMDRFDGSEGDHSNCANTELWIKLDRLEEVIGMLALTNIEIADTHRRLLGEQINLVGEQAGILADLANRHSPGDSTQ